MYPAPRQDFVPARIIHTEVRGTKVEKVSESIQCRYYGFCMEWQENIFFFFRVDLLGPFVQTLELISQDEELKRYLSRSVSRTTASSSLRDPTITQEDLPKVTVHIYNAFNKILS